MSVPVLTFFNNKGGVGKTTLVYHVAWMLARLGKTVVVVDLDPQANLTGAFIEENELETLWLADEQRAGPTVFSCIRPALKMGDLAEPELQQVTRRLFLLPGSMALATFEDDLTQQWNACLGTSNLYRPFRLLTAFWQIGQMAARKVDADMVLADVGPTLGALNRSALLGSDFVAIPLGADLFSLQGLRNLGPTLRSWRTEWNRRHANWTNAEFELPTGRMEPLGYMLQQHGVRLTRPVRAYDRWVARVPAIYRQSVLDVSPELTVTAREDPHCLAMLKHYHSLVPMAQEHRKPMFELSSADGAIGAHQQQVQLARADFEKLTRRLLAELQRR